MHLKAIVSATVLVLTLAGCGDDPAPGSDAVTDGSAPATATQTPTSASGLDLFADAYRDATGGNQVSWAPRVDFFYSGIPGESVDADDLQSASGWDGCPLGEDQYAARDCPVSPLRTLELIADAGAQLVSESTAPTTVGCDRPSQPDITAIEVISIRPDMDHRSCFEDFAITLYLDDSDSIVAVDLVLSSP